MIIGISGRSQSGKDLVGKIIQYLSYCNQFNTIAYSTWELLDNKHSSQNWKIKKFADKLKDIVCILIGCTREQLEDRVFKETPLGKEWEYNIISDEDIKNNYYPIICKCGWKGSSKDLDGGGQIADTGDYFDVYCPHCGTIEPDECDNTINLTPRKLLQLLGTECGRQIINPNIWVNATMGDYKQVGSPLVVMAKGLEPLYPNWIITDCRFPNEAKAITDKGGINIRINRPNVLNNQNNINLEHISETSLDNYKFDYVLDNNGTIDELIKQVKSILIKEQIL